VTLVAFDTSLAVSSACVLRDDGVAFWTPPPQARRLLGPSDHSQELLPELERLMSESGTSWGDVESIAIGIGPGTFTGLRIGVSTARALGQALGVGLKPVSSLEALAEGVAREADAPAGRTALSVIDARRGQVFAALYRLPAVRPSASPSRRRVDRRLEQVWEPAVLDPEKLLSRIGELEPGPVCVGDWAVESRGVLEGAGADVPLPDSGLHAVNALHVCRLGAGLEAVPPSDVHPVYLRLPDAEINRRLAR
jgi:tRNA threonylcarbamoyladenosine biosynthesis protein TsaB